MNNRNHPITAADARLTSAYWNGRQCDPSEIAKLSYSMATFEEEEDLDDDDDDDDCSSADRVAARRTAADSCGATSRNDSFITLDIDGEHLYQDADGTWLSYRTGKPYKPWKKSKSRKQPQRGVQS
ncbi:hypothetical protein IQ216_00115 [Cyanobium sp. LEGE 06143]|uniref:hypothetical protein n=1 Tax=Cyanobium sp. LEGE 06143 TaxID=945727 RepID=UPI0018803298|nr:hypothetical protein [Cyanobium sp. LEGE 06143]MBE9171550.1 hypothetical protein [Cyanobium sp. LEGE 06143]